jgi:type 1 glutamine amidotransferase
LSRSGFLSRVVLTTLFVAACSSSDSVGLSTAGLGGSDNNGSGGAESAGGQAGIATASTGGAAGTASTNEAGNNSGGANAGGRNDAGPSAEASRPSDAGGAVDTGHGNKILIYTKTTGFRHDSIPAAAAAISKSAVAAGLVTEQSEDTGKFVPAQLSQYAAVVLLATSGEPLGMPGTAQIQTLIDYVRAGGGLVAIEDANHSYDITDISLPYISLIGGDFTGHSGLGPDTCYKDGNHPSVVMLPASFAVNDEIYYFTKFGADNQVVLRCGSDKRPISWVRTEGAGRVFYTALGHADASWTSPPLVDGHVIPALLWTIGR